MSIATLERPKFEIKEGQQPQVVSILHWNVHLTSRLDEVVKYLRELQQVGVNPDFYCLLELTSDSPHNPQTNIPQILSYEFGMNYVFSAESFLARPRFSRTDHPTKVGTGVFTSFPIRKRRSEILSEGGMDYIYRERDIKRIFVEVTAQLSGDKTITVAATHLSLPWISKKQKELRREEADRLVDLIRENNESFVLTGDFNAGPNFYSVRQLLAAGLVRLDPQSATGRNTFQVGPIKKTLDHVFVSPDLSVKRARILPSGPSDHNPILIEVKV